jgi:hypothetical protein
MKKIWILLFLILTVTISAREMAGKVTSVEGDSHVKYRDRKDRTLVKGSPVFSEEKIIVGANSKLQIKFTDDAILNLIANTEYIVQDYSFENKKSKNIYLGEILKGGFRHLTGKIAKENPDAVTIKGPNVTIGIRGTLLQAFVRNGTMFVGCEFGQITVASRQGMIVLGPTSRFQYSSISEHDLNPKGLTKIPPELQQQNFTPPPGGVSTVAPKAPADVPKSASESSAPATQAEPESSSETNTIKIKGGC